MVQTRSAKYTTPIYAKKRVSYKPETVKESPVGAMKRRLDVETPAHSPVKLPMKEERLWTLEMAKQLQEETVQKYMEKKSIKEGNASCKSVVELARAFCRDNISTKSEEQYVNGCYETVYWFLCQIHKALCEDGKPVYITEKALWECMSLSITSTRDGLDRVINTGKIHLQPCGSIEFVNRTSEFFYDLAQTVKPLLVRYTGEEFEQLSAKFGPVKTVPYCFGYHLVFNPQFN